MVAHIRRPPQKRLPAQIPVPNLARGLGLSRYQTMQTLRNEGVPLRQRGCGEQRQHWFVTRSDLERIAPWILREIEDWHALLGRAAIRAAAADPDTEDD
jgi:hypothetical protein